MPRELVLALQRESTRNLQDMSPQGLAQLLTMLAAQVRHTSRSCLCLLCCVHVPVLLASMFVLCSVSMIRQVSVRREVSVSAHFALLDACGWLSYGWRTRICPPAPSCTFRTRAICAHSAVLPCMLNMCHSLLNCTAALVEWHLSALVLLLYRRV